MGRDKAGWPGIFKVSGIRWADGRVFLLFVPITFQPAGPIPARLECSRRGLGLTCPRREGRMGLGKMGRGGIAVNRSARGRMKWTSTTTQGKVAGGGIVRMGRSVGSCIGCGGNLFSCHRPSPLILPSNGLWICLREVTMHFEGPIPHVAYDEWEIHRCNEEEEKWGFWCWKHQVPINLPGEKLKNCGEYGKVEVERYV